MPAETDELSKEESERIIQDTQSKFGDGGEKIQEENEQQNREKIQPEKTEQQITGQTKQKVSAMDPDFIIFFFAACAFDFSDIFTDLLTTIIQVPLPKIFGIMIDVMAMLIIGGWIYYRTGQASGTSKAVNSLMAVVKRIAPAAVIEIGSGIGLGITSWIGLAPSWVIAVLSTLI